MNTHDAILEAKLKAIDDTHRFTADKSALLIIDMQHGFIDEGATLEVAAARDIIPNLASLIDAFRSRNTPVIFTEFVLISAKLITLLKEMRIAQLDF